MNIGMYYLTLFCFSLLIHKIDFDCIKAWTYAFNYMNMFFLDLLLPMRRRPSQSTRPSSARNTRKQRNQVGQLFSFSR